MATVSVTLMNHDGVQIVWHLLRLKECVLELGPVPLQFVLNHRGLILDFVLHRVQHLHRCLHLRRSQVFETDFVRLRVNHLLCFAVFRLGLIDEVDGPSQERVQGHAHVLSKDHEVLVLVLQFLKCLNFFFNAEEIFPELISLLFVLMHEHVSVDDFVKLEVVVFLDWLLALLVVLHSVQTEKQNIWRGDDPRFTHALLPFLFIYEALHIVLKRFIPCLIYSFVLYVQINRSKFLVFL